MLYHLFKWFTDLLSFDSSDYRSYTDAFQAYKWLHVHPDNFYTDLVADDQDTDSKEEEPLLY